MIVPKQFKHSLLPISFFLLCPTTHSATMSDSRYTESTLCSTGSEILSFPIITRASTPKLLDLDYESLDFGIPTPDLDERQISDTEIDFYDPTEPLPIFPPISTRTRAHDVSSLHSPAFADHQTIGFPEADEWTQVWNGREHHLDQYLQYQLDHKNISNPWSYEHTFQGAMYRLTIDPQARLDGMPTLTHGSIISVQDWNSIIYQYMIDHCVHKTALHAYLKVVCFDLTHRVYDICSLRPPLILVVPLRFSNVRMHPNLQDHSPTLASKLKAGYTKFVRKHLHPLWKQLSMVLKK
jgi:hypothetical protein